MGKTARRTARAARGRGTLGILVLLLACSAAIRLVSSADSVMAEAREAIAEADGPAARSEPAGATPTPGELDAVLRAFEEREARIRTQEVQIDKRLKAAEDELRATLSLASTAAEDDLSRLTTVYENMKPKTAAALFEAMAPEFAAGFLGRMRPEAAAAVMAGMTPESAYAISAILAGRNADVPKE